MAKTLDQLRGEAMHTSLHGRRFGLTSDEYLAGPKGMKRPLTEATASTTGTALGNIGMISLASSADKTWKLTDPDYGSKVTIFCGTAATTKAHTVSPVAATMISTNGVKSSSVALTGGVGDTCSLEAVSTSKWVVTANKGCVFSS